MNGAGAGSTPESRQFPLRPPVGSRRVRALCGGLVILTAGTVAGDFMSPALLERQPVLLLMLNSRTIYLVAVARRLPFAVFVFVATARLCVADPLHFLLGRQAGTASCSKATRLRPLMRRLPTPSSPLWLAVVAMSPTAKTMLVAGAAHVPGRAVAIANLLGTVGRVVLIWTAGRALPWVGDSFSGYASWFAVPCGLLAIALLATRWRRGTRPMPAVA